MVFPPKGYCGNTLFMTPFYNLFQLRDEPIKRIISSNTWICKHPQQQLETVKPKQLCRRGCSRSMICKTQTTPRDQAAVKCYRPKDLGIGTLDVNYRESPVIPCLPGAIPAPPSVKVSNDLTVAEPLYHLLVEVCKLLGIFWWNFSVFLQVLKFVEELVMCS